MAGVKPVLKVRALLWSAMMGLPAGEEANSVQAGTLKRGPALGRWCDPCPSLVHFS